MVTVFLIVSTRLNLNFGSGARAAGFIVVIAALAIFAFAQPARAASLTGWLDSVSSDGDSITVSGWAVDSDTPDATAGVHVYVNGSFETGGPASLHRPDVDRATGLGANHGFEIEFAANPGMQRVCVYAIDQTGDSNRLLDCQNVPVGDFGSTPVGWLDAVQGDDDSITVRGWTADPDAPETALQVRVTVDGRTKATELADQTRADVNRATGLGSNHGFNFSLGANSGRHRVCVHAADATRDAGSLLGCRNVDVGSFGNSPVGWLDAVRGTQDGLRIRGWTLDPDTTDSIGVHVYLNGAFHSGFTANNSRPDVDRAWNRGAAHGFNRLLDIESGWHSLCLYGIDRTGDAHARLGCRTILLNRQSDKPIERVSRFTTFFDCCQNRVTNIRQIAREIDRTVVLPGETFSIDEVTGPRTSSGGYLPAPYLINGQGACCAVGGGVSQFGTTIHNAVFWGGYRVVSHRPHSGYISRYPLGIEATLVYRSIDYRFTNDTDTPVIIRTSSTSTSVTVELWGYQGGWQMTGFHPRGSRSSSISVLDSGGSDAKRVRGSVSGSAPGTVRIVRTLTQGGVSTSQTWFWTYVR